MKTRNAGISQNMPEYHGICRNIAECLRNMPEYYPVPPEYAGTFKFIEIYKNIKLQLGAVHMSRASPANRADLSHENLYFSTT